MSIVGPRPERPELADQLAMAIPYFEERMRDVKPGITGFAQDLALVHPASRTPTATSPSSRPTWTNTIQVEGAEEALADHMRVKLLYESGGTAPPPRTSGTSCRRDGDLAQDAARDVAGRSGPEESERDDGGDRGSSRCPSRCWPIPISAIQIMIGVAGACSRRGSGARRKTRRRGAVAVDHRLPPGLNGGSYLPAKIASLLAQDYPRRASRS